MSDQTSPRPSADSPAAWEMRGSPLDRAKFFIWFTLFATLALLTVNVWLLARAMQLQRAGSREHAFWILSQPGSPAAARELAFRQLVAAGNEEWRSADLQELNLSGISLAGASLRAGTFARTAFVGANLSRARFCNSLLEQVDFTGANLQEADLSESVLIRAILKNANLRRAKLRTASLAQAQAENVDLLVADLSEATCLMANLTGAKLDGANLSGATLESAVLNNATLTLARLDGAELKHAEFKNANWWRARGLRTDQIEFLKQKFSPTADADAALKQDYAKWLAEAGK